MIAENNYGKVLAVFSVFLIILFSNGVYSQEIQNEAEFAETGFELRHGILPDSPFYFVERFFDTFRGPESIAERKVSEVIVMAEKGNENATEKALVYYGRALERLQERSENREEVAERVANRTSIHLAVLAEVYEKVPEKVKPAIERAMENSVRGRERAIEALERMNPEKGEMVRERTIKRVVENTPDESQEGLQRALEAGGSDKTREQYQKEKNETTGGGNINQTGDNTQDSYNGETGDEEETYYCKTFPSEEGSNPLQKGDCIDSIHPNGGYPDSCINTTHLNETYCSNIDKGCIYSVIDCRNVRCGAENCDKCDSGACIRTEECSIKNEAVHVSDNCGDDGCDVGESINIHVAFDSGCLSKIPEYNSAKIYVQVDGMSTDGRCSIEHNKGDIQGMDIKCANVYCTTYGFCICNGEWKIPGTKIPSDCQGKTVLAWKVGLYYSPEFSPEYYIVGNHTALPTNPVFSASVPYGSFTFVGDGNCDSAIIGNTEYVCGKADNVCPEDYFSDETGTRPICDGSCLDPDCLTPVLS